MPKAKTSEKAVDDDQAAGRWTSPPGDYFFVVGRDRGLWTLQNLDWLIRPVRGARVRQYACSDHPSVQKVIKRNLEPRWHEAVPVVFETNTVPVIASNVVFRGGNAQVNGKFLPNGAAGDRSFSRYLKQNPGTQAYRRTNRFFNHARRDTAVELPVWPLASASIPVGIECRNRTNFYHFMTETLPQLVHYAAAPPEQITIHCRNDEPSRFSARFIEALFPELAGSIEFTAKASEYERVNLPLNFRHMIYASGDPRIRSLVADTPTDPEWETVSPHTQRRKFILKNTYDVSLRLLRERALTMISQADLDKMPKRIWVSRDPKAHTVNQRQMIGEEKLVARLREQGFEQVYFENMSPLEQIAAVYGAEVIGSAHGAFFANMMFANPDAHVIEVGSVLTQFHRWGDFLGNAHASGCRYSIVFADTATDDPSDIPSINDGLVGVRLGDRAIDTICRLAAEGQFT